MWAVYRHLRAKFISIGRHLGVPMLLLWQFTARRQMSVDFLGEYNSHNSVLKLAAAAHFNLLTCCSWRLFSRRLLIGIHSLTKFHAERPITFE
jgi:hypothetical protein